MVKGNIFAAPLAGYSNFPTRMLYQEHGADLTFTEMISARGIVHEDEKTLALLYTDKNEKNKAVQIFDDDKYILSEACEYIQTKTPYKIININAGCSVKKILRANKGGALLKDPRKLNDILHYISKNIRIHLTLKIRSGWDENDLNYRRIGKIASDNNCKMIIFHPRTVKQVFSGKANWDQVYDLKKKVPIPVIGNGDIFTVQEAYDRLKHPVDGIMVGRGAIGNPWIFENIKKFIKGERYTEPDPKEKIRGMFLHLQKMVQFFGERKGIIIFRCQMAQYIKSFKDSAGIRKKIQICDKFSEIEKILAEYK